MKVMAGYYEQFDADYSLDVPAEGFGGWKRGEIELAPEHTAVVVMHAWHSRTRREFPGWYGCVEYHPRAAEICRSIFPPLLSAVRGSRLELLHVVGGGDYYSHLRGYRRAVELAGPEPPAPKSVEPDPALEALQKFRADNVHPGRANRADVQRAAEQRDFAPQAVPEGEEGVAENAHQLFALCRDAQINHLVYTGFAINWCLLLSPGGMAEMQKHGLMCSALRQATTAVENRQTAREELCKEIALWRVALAFGFVFDLKDFLGAIREESANAEL